MTGETDHAPETGRENSGVRISSRAPGLFIDGTAHIGGVHVFGPSQMQATGGRWTCLLGPSGVGKSTLLRLLAGTAGHVQFNGMSGADDREPLAGRCALMAQTDLLMPWLSILDNVLLGARLRGQHPDRARAERILTQTGLAPLATRKPAALSGGQRQRAALARTLMEDRPVILLDEPFSALDVATRARMQDLAADAFAGRTVLHVTHDPAEAARLGHRILVMSQRSIAEARAPQAAMPRAFDDPETLAATARLTNLLLETAP